MTNATDKNAMDQTKEEIKRLMKQLKCTEDDETLEKYKREFKDVIKKANPLLIAMAENELVNEGFSREDLMSSCDVHLMLFQDAISNTKLDVPEDHPLHRFHLEHMWIIDQESKLREAVKSARTKGSYEAAAAELAEMERLLDRLRQAESHDVRQENTLFPVLEKHGVEQPPAIMWAEHGEMKDVKKEMQRIVRERTLMPFAEFVKIMGQLSLRLLEQFSAHTKKEEHILYMTALEVITKAEWKDIKSECDQLGYFELD